jgi:hypothetical protein
MKPVTAGERKVKFWPQSRNAQFLAAAGVAAAGVVGGYFLLAPTRMTAHSGGFVRDGEAGFVVTQFAYALGPDASETGSCTTGMSKNVAEIYGKSEVGRRRPGENDEDYSKRLEDGGKSISVTADGKDYCTNPQLAPPDPHARYHTNPDAKADGLNLDGRISRSQTDMASGRLDFTGLNGTAGVDNQLWRVVGCSKPYQSAGQAVGFGMEMYTGSWGLLIKLEDLDDLKNDNHVTVRVYSNADPMQISPAREALEYATYAFDRDPAYQAKASGTLKNGVLTTEPFNFQFRRVTNAMYVDRPLNKARIQATLSANGTIKGYLAGYTPVEQMYDFQFGYRSAKGGNGKAADPRRVIGTANGAARTLGYTCQGMYQGLHRFADGDFDAKSRKYTSISTQYRFEARPAFIVDVETKSTNEKLTK